MILARQVIATPKVFFKDSENGEDFLKSQELGVLRKEEYEN